MRRWDFMMCAFCAAKWEFAQLCSDSELYARLLLISSLRLQHTLRRPCIPGRIQQSPPVWKTSALTYSALRLSSFLANNEVHFGGTPTSRIPQSSSRTSKVSTGRCSLRNWNILSRALCDLAKRNSSSCSSCILVNVAESSIYLATKQDATFEWPSFSVPRRRMAEEMNTTLASSINKRLVSTLVDLRGVVESNFFEACQRKCLLITRRGRNGSGDDFTHWTDCD